MAALALSPANATSDKEQVNPGREKIDEAEAFNDLGVARMRLDRAEEAVEFYMAALKIRPAYGQALSNLGNALAALGRRDEALTQYHAAVTVDPDNADAHYNLGSALYTFDRAQDALEHFHRALAIRPNFAQAHNNLGIALQSLNRLDEAYKHYVLALTSNPALADAWCNAGIILTELGHLDLARNAHQAAIDLAPSTAKYYFNFADVWTFKEDDKYLAPMRQIAGQTDTLSDRERIEIEFALGKAMADIGDHDRAFQHFLSGNRLRRSQITYDEAEVLSLMERIKSLFTAEFIAQANGKGDPSQVPIFIFGMPRSGTTLIEQILASLPSVHGAGELYEFANLTASLSKEGQEFPEVVASLSGTQVQTLGATYVEALRAFAPDARRVTDKMLWNFQFAGSIHMALPNARLIHARRDPVDTCLSCFTKLFTNHQLHTYDLGELGRYYRAYQSMTAHWQAVLPADTLLEVRYEDVIEDFETQARRIVAFCGLEWTDACLAFDKTKRPVRTASAAQVRQPLYRTSVGRWRPYRNHLGPLFEALEMPIPG
jgi:tetratricopeptide (TPR) repeat protein